MGWVSVVPLCLLVNNLGLIYSTINPLITLFTTLFFAIALIVYKYNFVCVYSRPFDAGGTVWVSLLNRVIVGLMMYQVRTTYAPCLWRVWRSVTGA